MIDFFYYCFKPDCTKNVIIFRNESSFVSHLITAHHFKKKSKDSLQYNGSIFTKQNKYADSQVVFDKNCWFGFAENKTIMNEEIAFFKTTFKSIKEQPKIIDKPTSQYIRCTYCGIMVKHEADRYKIHLILHEKQTGIPLIRLNR